MTGSSGMRVRKDDTGQFGHADLLAQWDEERNGPLKPSDVSRCDPARVWWCGECGHSWQLSVRTRAFNDAGVFATIKIDTSLRRISTFR